MKSQFYPPVKGKNQFHCVRCGVFASQAWRPLKIDLPNEYKDTRFQASYCYHCGDWCFWYDERMIVPNASPVERMHSDLPEDCRADYEEAREIVTSSPRGAVALLRLCVQKLMPHLGEKGDNINADIKSLVGKGLPPLVQQALDYCRVVGNNAVHPGALDINDTPEIAHQLFNMINFIVDDRIARPKEIEALYARLPQGALEAIAKRDSNT